MMFSNVGTHVLTDLLCSHCSCNHRVQVCRGGIALRARDPTCTPPPALHALGTEIRSMEHTKEQLYREEVAIRKIWRER